MVDLLDFPCSIWPGIVDIIGKDRPIIVVGNKVRKINTLDFYCRFTHNLKGKTYVGIYLFSGGPFTWR